MVSLPSKYSSILCFTSWVLFFLLQISCEEKEKKTNEMKQKDNIN